MRDGSGEEAAKPRVWDALEKGWKPWLRSLSSLECLLLDFLGLLGYHAELGLASMIDTETEFKNLRILGLSGVPGDDIPSFLEAHPRLDVLRLGNVDLDGGLGVWLRALRRVNRAKEVNLYGLAWAGDTEWDLDELNKEKAISDYVTGGLDTLGLRDRDLLDDEDL